MNGNNIFENEGLFNALTLFSVILQLMGYQNDLAQTSTDDLMEELQRQDRAYLDQIIKNQKLILKKLADLEADYSKGRGNLPLVDFD